MQVQPRSAAQPVAQVNLISLCISKLNEDCSMTVISSPFKAQIDKACIHAHAFHMLTDSEPCSVLDCCRAVVWNQLSHCSLIRVFDLQKLTGSKQQPQLTSLH